MHYKSVSDFSWVLGMSLLFLCACATPSSQKSLSQSTDQVLTQTLSAEHIYWVNSSQTSCVGVILRSCLLVQKATEISSDAWKSFYAPIEGFDYEPGFIYQLKVKEEVLPAHLVAADASSIRYSLLAVINKAVDDSFSLQGTWVLESLAGQAIVLTSSQVKPQLNINLNNMQIRGTDSCNHLMGSIKEVGKTAIKLSKIATTRKYCQAMSIAHAFNRALANVAFYQINEGRLILENEQGKELLSFSKGG